MANWLRAAAHCALNNKTVTNTTMTIYGFAASTTKEQLSCCPGALLHKNEEELRLVIGFVIDFRVSTSPHNLDMCGKSAAAECEDGVLEIEDSVALSIQSVRWYQNSLNTIFV